MFTHYMCVCVCPQTCVTGLLFIITVGFTKENSECIKALKWLYEVVRCDMCMPAEQTGMDECGGRQNVQETGRATTQ